MIGFILTFELPCHGPDGTDPSSVARNVHNYLYYGKKNKESLAELFITLLVKVILVLYFYQFISDKIIALILF